MEEQPEHDRVMWPAHLDTDGASEQEDDCVPASRQVTCWAFVTAIQPSHFLSLNMFNIYFCEWNRYQITKVKSGIQESLENKEEAKPKQVFLSQLFVNMSVETIRNKFIWMLASLPDSSGSSGD